MACQKLEAVSCIDSTSERLLRGATEIFCYNYICISGMAGFRFSACNYVKKNFDFGNGFHEISLLTRKVKSWKSTLF